MIELKNVSRVFGNFKAVDNVSFKIEKGEVVGLLGPNGAGKTTTMRMIAGFLKASEGKIRIAGLDIDKSLRECKEKIGYMMEGSLLYPDMIVYDYLAYVCAMRGKNEKQLEKIVDVCSLSSVMSKYIGELSKGFKQRVGLAHALMGESEVLILDEPTSGLDPAQIKEVRSLIRELGKTKTLIVSTHILNEVELLASRVLIISNGKLVADSSVSELKGSYSSSSFIQAKIKGEKERVLRLLRGAGFENEVQIKEENGFFILRLPLSEEETPSKIAALLVKSGVSLYELKEEKNSLEEVFLKMTNQKENKDE